MQCIYPMQQLLVFYSESYLKIGLLLELSVKMYSTKWNRVNTVQKFPWKKYESREGPNASIPFPLEECLVWVFQSDG